MDAFKSKLNSLKEEKKFLRDSVTFYPGAGSESEREKLEILINSLIERLIQKLEYVDKKGILNEFKISLDTANDFDTENREQICAYLQKIMDIFGIESSDGLLNKWMYGF